jgi:hypothetical protein
VDGKRHEEVASLVNENQEREASDGDGDVQRSPSEKIAFAGRKKRYAFAFGMTQKAV